MKVGSDSVAKNQKLNTVVTVAHIFVTLALTITQSLLFFIPKNYTQDFRMAAAFNFFGGFADMFLSIMLWFIFDNKPTLFVDRYSIYAVEDII